MDGWLTILLAGNGITIDDYYGSFPHSLRETHQD